MPNAIPEIFVLWHPRCALGEIFARRIYAWLRPGNGMGPQVYFRSLPAPEAPPGGLPPPLPGEVRTGSDRVAMAAAISNMQIVVMLVDEHMIADATWRHWMDQLALPLPDGSQRVILPVALDPTAYNVPPRLRECNFLRPKNLPEKTATDAERDAAIQAAARSLQKQLTEALCDKLLGNRDWNDAATAPAATPKVRIFLSHAKADGITPARRIRDYIYSQTQLAAFYDENDIPYGASFTRVLTDNAGGDHTAAMIAVISTRYAYRPWCRRELSLFRRPIPEQPAPGIAERWRMHPLLALDAVDGGTQTLGIPELGNAPVIRWDDQRADLEEQVVTTAIRDVLLASYHASVADTLPAAPDVIAINWQPDPTTLLQIPRIRNQAEELRVFHPGRGLSGQELDILDTLFPKVAFLSFEAMTT